LKRRVVKTSDGSHTLEINEGAEHYHSTHGAIQESRHVFVEMGLEHMHRAVEALSILEIGFGTGLNALLTLEWAEKELVAIDYTGLEAYPLSEQEWSGLNYPDQLDWSGALDSWSRLHRGPWGESFRVGSEFQMTKRAQKVQDFNEVSRFDVVYFDAFGPRHQPNMWTDEVFETVFDACKPGGILVTYCAKGEVRRTMQRVGFEVERLQGPPGKREMLRATKPGS